MCRPSAEQLLAMWMGCLGGFDVGMLTADFCYDHPHEKANAEEFALRIRNGGSWSGVRALSRGEGANNSAVVVEATDEITLLRYRVAWIVEYSGEQVRAIIATSCQVLG